MSLTGTLTGRALFEQSISGITVDSVVFGRLHLLAVLIILLHRRSHKPAASRNTQITIGKYRQVCDLLLAFLFYKNKKPPKNTCILMYYLKLRCQNNWITGKQNMCVPYIFLKKFLHRKRNCHTVALRSLHTGNKATRLSKTNTQMSCQQNISIHTKGYANMCLKFV